MSDDRSTNSLGLGGKIARIPIERAGDIQPIRESEVVAPASMIALGDTLAQLGRDIDPFPGALAGYPDLSISMSVTFYNPPAIARMLSGQLRQNYGYLDPNATLRALEQRHSNRTLITCCDGHVEGPRNSDLFEYLPSDWLRRWNLDNQPHREKLSIGK